MAYLTRELSAETWPDFEALFSRGNGWDFCWCMAMHAVGQSRLRTRAERSAVNHQEKQALVAEGRADGILIYTDGEVVGWCQFGPADELRPATEGPQWRITCFVVDKRHQRRGVAGIALRAALEAIRARGGGVVEAYPVAAWTHGREATSRSVRVRGAGDVAPAWGSFGNVAYGGTLAMFTREGFVPVDVLPSPSARVSASGANGASGASGYRVIVRKTV